MKKLSVFLFFILACNNNSVNSNSGSKPESSIAPPAVQSTTPISSAILISDSSKETFSGKEMVHIVGDFCSKVEEKCKTWKDDPASNKFARCLEFHPSVCVGPKKHMDFWIDKYEHKEENTNLPMSDVSWTQAKAICESEGKRLPTEDEWTLAAEGPDMLPYTTGFVRPTGICNIDLEKDIICGKKLCDHRRAITDNPQCISGYGVVNMAGNVDEFVSVPAYAHSKNKSLWMRSGLKGGHWLPIRARTRPITKDHDESFHQISAGFRCSKDK